MSSWLACCRSRNRRKSFRGGELISHVVASSFRSDFSARVDGAGLFSRVRCSATKSAPDSGGGCFTAPRCGGFWLTQPRLGFLRVWTRRVPL